jgi:hypothetical protein
MHKFGRSAVIRITNRLTPPECASAPSSAGRRQALRYARPHSPHRRPGLPHHVTSARQTSRRTIVFTRAGWRNRAAASAPPALAASKAARTRPLFYAQCPLRVDFVEEPRSGTVATGVGGRLFGGKLRPLRLMRRRSAPEAGRASPISANSGRWRPIGTRPSPRSDPADAIGRA